MKVSRGSEAKRSCSVGVADDSAPFGAKGTRGGRTLWRSLGSEVHAMREPCLRAGTTVWSTVESLWDQRRSPRAPTQSLSVQASRVQSSWPLGAARNRLWTETDPPARVSAEAAHPLPPARTGFGPLFPVRVRGVRLEDARTSTVGRLTEHPVIGGHRRGPRSQERPTMSLWCESRTLLTRSPSPAS
jgi:hypothetical protein